MGKKEQKSLQVCCIRTTIRTWLQTLKEATYLVLRLD